MTHPLVKTLMFGFLLIIQQNLVLCLTKFVDTLLQPISKSQKSYLSLKRQMWKTEHFLFRWTLWVLTQIYSKTRVYWNCLSQSIWKFLQRQPIPTHYLPEMLRLIDPQRKFLPLQWKALPTKPWNCNGHKDSSFDSFANIFMTYIETTTLRKTVFRTTATYTISFPYGTLVNQTSKPSLNKQTYITQLLNSRPKHLTLRLCF